MELVFIFLWRKHILCNLAHDALWGRGILMLTFLALARSWCYAAWGVGGWGFWGAVCCPFMCLADCHGSPLPLSVSAKPIRSRPTSWLQAPTVHKAPFGAYQNWAFLGLYRCQPAVTYGCGPSMPELVRPFLNWHIGCRLCEDVHVACLKSLMPLGTKAFQRHCGLTLRDARNLCAAAV